MPFINDDTIAAIASPPGPSLRGMTRISGDRTGEVLEKIFRPDDRKRWAESRVPVAHPGLLTLSEFRQPVEVVVCFWPIRRSYTGQPMAEIQSPGSPPLLETLLLELTRHGVRPAAPGEFTLRAFLSGRIDLVQAEAVLGVIDASHQYGLATALKQLAGGISGPITKMRDGLVDLLSDLEAGLDFVDEDIEFISRMEVIERLTEAKATVEILLHQATGRAESVGQRIIVLAGLPNVGKSTLFNVLVGRDEAIVSPIEGTTRDFLQATGNWSGAEINLVDTAGWEEIEQGIAASAQQFRDERFGNADLIIWCSAADANQESQKTDERLYESVVEAGHPVIRIMTKCDLRSSETSALENILAVSAESQENLNALREAALKTLSESDHSDRSQLLGSTAARTRGSLEGAISSLETALRISEDRWGDELIALEVRSALEHFGALVGEIYTDDLLDRIFSKFCIGK